MFSVKFLVKTIKTLGCDSLLASFLLRLPSGSDFNKHPPRLAAQRHNTAFELLHQHSYAPRQNRKDCRLVEDWHDDAVANAWKIVRHGNFRS